MSRIVKVRPEGKRVVIIGATSGIGRELALMYLAQGCTVGVAGRRTEVLEEIVAQSGGRAFMCTMDVQKEDCADRLSELIMKMGGMDLLIYSAGVGTQNPELSPDIETGGVLTNVMGYTKIAVHAFNYFKERGTGGQIAVLSSVAGTKPLRQSPAYSATKRYQMHYTSCLAQKSHKERLGIRFTTVVPGFIRTPMLKFKYPLSIDLGKGSRLIFNGIERRRRIAVVPGRWRVVRFIWNLIPNSIWERVW